MWLDVQDYYEFITFIALEFTFIDYYEFITFIDCYEFITFIALSKIHTWAK